MLRVCIQRHVRRNGAVTDDHSGSGKRTEGDVDSGGDHQHHHGGHHDFSTMTEKDQQDLYGAGSFDTKEMRSEKNVHLKGKRAAGKVGEEEEPMVVVALQ